MSKFRDFFPDKVEQSAEREFTVSSRGLPAFTIRPLTTDEISRIRKAATHPVKVKKGVVQNVTEATEVQMGMVLAAVTFPDLNDAELQQAWSVMGAEALIGAMLLPGEYDELIAKVAEICGYEQDMNELVEDAKN